MGKKGLFSHQMAFHTPPKKSAWVRSRAESNHELTSAKRKTKQDALLQQLEVAAHSQRENLVKFNAGLLQLKGSVGKLSSSYEARKAEQAKAASRLNFFVSVKPDRPEEINFIASIAASLPFAKAAAIPLTALKTAPQDLNRVSETMSSIVNGAYLFVTKEIEATYKAAWVSKDPTSSQLYLELTHRLGEQSNEEQLAALKALQTHLQKDGVAAQVNFGPHKSEDVLAKIQEYIQELEVSAAAAAVMI